MELVSTKEGQAEILHYPGDIKKTDAVFFNPKMQLNRDISVLALKTFRSMHWRNVRVADIMAASGARSIRYSKEVEGVEEILANDLNPTALDVIQKNIEKNGCANITITKKDANVLLSEWKNKVDYVDIDPFGSPIDFLDSAARALNTTALLGVTATDTPPLCGTYPTTCIRRYGSRPFRKEINHEIGLRILVHVIMRELAKYEKAYFPMVCYSHLHYFRLIGTVKKRTGDVDRQLKKIGYFWYCTACKARGFSPKEKSECEGCAAKKVDNAGPLYTGRLFDTPFIEKMLSYEMDEKTRKFLEILHGESDVDGIPYNLHELNMQRRTDDVIAEMKKAGYSAVKSHYGGQFVRSDGNIAALKRL